MAGMQTMYSAKAMPTKGIKFCKALIGARGKDEMMESKLKKRAMVWGIILVVILLVDILKGFIFVNLSPLASRNDIYMHVLMYHRPLSDTFFQEILFEAVGYSVWLMELVLIAVVLLAFLPFVLQALIKVKGKTPLIIRILMFPPAVIFLACTVFQSLELADFLSLYPSFSIPFTFLTGVMLFKLISLAGLAIVCVITGIKPDARAIRPIAIIALAACAVALALQATGIFTSSVGYLTSEYSELNIIISVAFCIIIGSERFLAAYLVYLFSKRVAFAKGARKKDGSIPTAPVPLGFQPNQSAIGVAVSGTGFMQVPGSFATGEQGAVDTVSETGDEQTPSSFATGEQGAVNTVSETGAGQMPGPFVTREQGAVDTVSETGDEQTPGSFATGEQGAVNTVSETRAGQMPGSFVTDEQGAVDVASVAGADPVPDFAVLSVGAQFGTLDGSRPVVLQETLEQGSPQEDVPVVSVDMPEAGSPQADVSAMLSSRQNSPLPEKKNYCNKCGSRILPNMLFCSKCGAGFEEEKKSQSDSTLPSSDVLTIGADEKMNEKDSPKGEFVQQSARPNQQVSPFGTQPVYSGQTVPYPDTQAGQQALSSGAQPVHPGQQAQRPEPFGGTSPQFGPQDPQAGYPTSQFGPQSPQAGYSTPPFQPAQFGTPPMQSGAANQQTGYPTSPSQPAQSGVRPIPLQQRPSHQAPPFGAQPGQFGQQAPYPDAQAGQQALSSGAQSVHPGPQAPPFGAQPGQFGHQAPYPDAHVYSGQQAPRPEPFREASPQSGPQGSQTGYSTPQSGPQGPQAEYSTPQSGSQGPQAEYSASQPPSAQFGIPQMQSGIANQQTGYPTPPSQPAQFGTPPIPPQQSTKYCTRCGNILAPSEMYCVRCGTEQR
jgi:hypothetical protein